ncbi:glycosyltransferase [Trinickia fusca]|uniref:Glycosyltransferase family 2 protein n=1 Tax=Trinickia fusca TaxID=2419777 RepID=A0A494XJE9_9BURK|nr:glycosyltransferase [Trinickia fusca]RKP50847.1 glycosyltransferase family 2 protein [Trinickia fusca]
MDRPDSSNLAVSQASSTGEAGLSISVVVYRPDIALLNRTLASVAEAYGRLREARGQVPLTLFIVDNGGLPEPDIAHSLALLAKQGIVHTVLGGHGNIGYGRGHNLAIERATSRFHLVLNPDIDMDANVFVSALDFLDGHPEAGLVAPRIDDDEHGIQYLCRRYPTVLDLFVRGFLPEAIRRCFASRLGRYEMRDVINGNDVVWDPLIVSGCFMLFRTEVLKRLSGFDLRYFLYFEDYDLSLRAHELTRVVYVPAVRAVHHGGGAARKGAAHIRMFMASAFKFYNRFGWKWL